MIRISPHHGHGPVAAHHPLFSQDQSRAIEAGALAQHPPFTLMPRAGRAVAKLVLAIAPHAQTVWVAVGPGNNGGDGLLAAAELSRLGLRVTAIVCHDHHPCPGDAARARDEAIQAGVQCRTDWPQGLPEVLIDALLGLGQSRAPEGKMALAVRSINALRDRCTVLSVDLPTGLCADTGQQWSSDAVKAHATLSLLTLKPGLFTGQGRALAGHVWLDTLDCSVAADVTPPRARLICGAMPPARSPTSHKGSHGTVLVLGGQAGMEGACWMAAQAALVAGAGKVYAAPLSGQALPHHWPALMRHALPDPGSVLEIPEDTVLLCGCGGGQHIAPWMPAALRHRGPLVIDADGLNALAMHPPLLRALQQRSKSGRATALTPHPLEAARLLACSVSDVQRDRLAMAERLTAQTGAQVVLKGSGTVVVDHAGQTSLNGSGNGRLATAGTGDVLAGWIAGWWAMCRNHAELAHWTRAAVWWHGQAAEAQAGQALTAPSLIEAMARLTP